MSSSVSSTSNGSTASNASSFPKNFVLSYEMKFRVFNKDLLKKQINKFNKIMNDKYFDFSIKFNDYSPSFLLLPFLKKLNSFNTVLVKKNKIDASDYFQVLELIRQIKTKMFRSIEKKYLEHGTLENSDVNLSESTNNLLDQLFNPEEFNKILNNKPMIDIFKTNYINPPELDVKEIFITKEDEDEDSDNEPDWHDVHQELMIERNDYKDKYEEMKKKYDELHNKTIDIEYMDVLDKNLKDMKKKNNELYAKTIDYDYLLKQNKELTKDNELADDNLKTLRNCIDTKRLEIKLLEEKNKKIKENLVDCEWKILKYIEELEDMTRDRNNYKTLCDGFSKEADEKLNYLKFYLLKSDDKKDYHFDDLMKILESKLLAKKDCLTCDVREMIKENKKK